VTSRRSPLLLPEAPVETAFLRDYFERVGLVNGDRNLQGRQIIGTW
jgi:hypothetical protein